MTPATLGLILLVIFFVMLFLRIPIAVSIGLSTLVTMLISGMPIGSFASQMLTGTQKYTLLAMPFFILAGNIMTHSGISKRIVNFANLLCGDIPGGIAIISIIVTVFWGALSGSAPATVVALGMVLIPGMIEAGYSPAFAAATIACSAAISVVIPPSIPMVAYGVVQGASIGDLLLGGVFPGLLMGLACIVWAFVVSKKRGYKGARFGTGKEIWKGFKDAFWGLITPIIILGGIYGGFVSPTEAAVIACVYSLIVGLFIYKDFKIKDLRKILAESANSSASIMLILATASMLAYLLTVSGIGSAVTAAVAGVSSSKWVTMLFILIIIFIAGFFLDAISIIYIFAPLLTPIATQLGYTSVEFGVIMIMGIAVGFATPPVATNLYPACKIADITIVEITKEVWGFVFAMIVSCIIVIFLPQIVSWLPSVAL